MTTKPKPLSPCPELTSECAKVKEIIQNNNKFVITSHVNPDGDSLGCELALARFLKKLKKSVVILNHNDTPAFYKFLDTNSELVKFNPDYHQKIILNADVIFIVDTNQPDRLRSLEPVVVQSKSTKVIIDHHLDADDFADFYLLDEDATSTAEILYNLLVSIDSSIIDHDIAQPLYTAIMTDTGSFRFPRTDTETHQIIADLLQYDVDPTAVYSQVYESWSLGRMRLLGEALDSLKTEYDGKLAFMVCTQKMFEATETTEVETDNFTNYPMNIEGVQVGLLFNELDDGIKISFRSKGDIPINELAKEFSGGGHKNAAGARLFNVKLEDIVKEVIKKARKYLQ
ncbi:MAG: bifunctional oligoribonuclease/PAP phosphatase NrnA [Bacteroidota bacterium]|nr:bifunctional oligoribonuclease/PAP phosphatase NrnA [Bacteroidota bacterium]